MNACCLRSPEEGMYVVDGCEPGFCKSDKCPKLLCHLSSTMHVFVREKVLCYKFFHTLCESGHTRALDFVMRSHSCGMA